MTEREQSFIKEALKPVNLRILWTGVSLLVTGAIGVTAAYYGIINEIRTDKLQGNHKDEMQDVRMMNIENTMTAKAWRSELDNLRQRVELNEKVNETLRK
jgi:hypothetical protein